MSRTFVADCLDLASEQGWRHAKTANGWKLMPPIGRCQPGYDIVHIAEPRGNHRGMDEIRTRLRRAGLKFPDERKQSEKPMAQAGSPPRISQAGAPAEQKAKPNRFVAVRQKLASIFDLVTEVEQDLQAIEADGAQVAKFRELIKAMQE